jgi:hypothetical protein
VSGTIPASFASLKHLVVLDGRGSLVEALPTASDLARSYPLSVGHEFGDGLDGLSLCTALPALAREGCDLFAAPIARCPLSPCARTCGVTACGVEARSLSERERAADAPRGPRAGSGPRSNPWVARAAGAWASGGGLLAAAALATGAALVAGPRRVRRAAATLAALARAGRESVRWGGAGPVASAVGAYQDPDDFCGGEGEADEAMDPEAMDPEAMDPEAMSLGMYGAVG